jgi:hypothetical protein
MNTGGSRITFNKINIIVKDQIIVIGCVYFIDVDPKSTLVVFDKKVRSQR